MAQLSGLDSKTLNQDSVCPPLAAGKLRIYNMRFCPFAHRTILALAAKNITAEVVNVNLKHKPAWFLEKNPLGKVPTLEKDGVVVFDSPICNEWLDDTFPEHRILPTDPLAKARQKMLLEQMSPIQPALFQLYRMKETAAQSISDAFKICQQLLKHDYYGGSSPGFADYMLWSFFERLEAVGVVTGGQMSVPWAQFPGLLAYKERMKGRPEVLAVAKSPELHAEYIRSYLNEEANYDAGLDIGPQLIGLNSKTLNEDSVCPPLADGKLRIYNMRFCPFAHRTILALSAKNITAEVVNVNLKHRPAWFLEKNPLGKVPILEKDGVVIYDSAICNEWLEESFPDTNKILPTNPLAKAQQKMLLEQMSPIQPALFQLYRMKETAAQFISDAFKICEQLLKQDYYGGSSPSWADYMLWPFFERLEAVGVVTEGQMSVPWAQFPGILAYKERMMGRPEVRAVAKSPELHAEYIRSYLNEEFNFDAGLVP